MKQYKGGGYTSDVSNPILSTIAPSYKPYVDNNVYVQSGDLGLIPLVSNVYNKHELTGGKALNKSRKMKSKKMKSRKMKSKNMKSKKISRPKKNSKPRKIRSGKKSLTKILKYKSVRVGKKIVLSDGKCAVKIKNGQIRYIKNSKC